MRRRLLGQRGMSLVEATIILLVLMLLTAVLTPSIFDFVNDARFVKVKEDCEVIGINVARITRDVGTCLKFTGTSACTKANRVDVLASDGPNVTAADLASTAPNFSAPSSSATKTVYNWDDDDTGSVADSMVDQFVTNVPNYDAPGELSPTGWTDPKPAFGRGWRGAYVQSPIGPDPWGSRYLVNSIFLTVASDATAGTTEGLLSGGWDRDVFCISPGPNRLYQSPFGGNSTFGLERNGDDETFVISGSTR